MSASGPVVRPWFAHGCGTGLAAKAVLAVALGVAGCASSVPTRFHTLLPAPSGAPNAGTAPDVRFDLAVGVPAQVDQPQIVLRLPDDTMTALEHDRWVAPLPDEIRSAVRQRIDMALSGLPTAASKPAPPWRIALDVTRFDSMLGRAVSVQAQWTLQAPDGSTPPLRCQVAIERRVGDSVAAVTAGHRAAFEQLGDAIGQALKAAASGNQPSCG